MRKDVPITWREVPVILSTALILAGIFGTSAVALYRLQSVEDSVRSMKVDIAQIKSAMGIGEIVSRQ